MGEYMEIWNIGNGCLDTVRGVHLDHRVWRWRVFAAVIAGDLSMCLDR